MPHRLLIVTTELGMGGAERCVANLACGLDRDEWDVHEVALTGPPQPPKDAHVSQHQPAGVPLTFLGCRGKWQLPQAVKKLRQMIREDQPAVVLSFLFHANVVANLAAGGLQVPQIQSLRVIEQGRWRRRVQAWAARRAARVLCVSQGVRQFALETLRLPDEKLQVIPNGIDVASIAPVAIPRPGADKLRLLAMGRLDAQKGFDWLISQCSGLDKSLAEPTEWELVIVGDGPQHDRLSELVRKLGLHDQVKLVGWQPHPSDWLAKSDIFVLSSRWEGMPNALIEAMAHGLPVMATPVEGVAELLSGDLAEQIVPVGDHVAATALLTQLMFSPEDRARLGQANRRQIEAHFSLRQMVQLYQTALSDALA